MCSAWLLDDSKDHYNEISWQSCTYFLNDMITTQQRLACNKLLKVLIVMIICKVCLHSEVKQHITTYVSSPPVIGRR